MGIQESTRQMIIDELLMIGCVTGQMGVAEFCEKYILKLIACLRRITGLE